MALKLIRKFAVASLLTLLSSATVSAQTLVFTAIPDEDETNWWNASRVSPITWQESWT